MDCRYFPKYLVVKVYFLYGMLLLLVIIVLFVIWGNITASFSVHIVCVPHCHVLSHPNYKINVQFIV